MSMKCVYTTENIARKHDGYCLVMQPQFKQRLKGRNWYSKQGAQWCLFSVDLDDSNHQEFWRYSGNEVIHP